MLLQTETKGLRVYSRTACAVYSVAGVTVGWRVNEIQLGEHINQYATLILCYSSGLRSQAATHGPQVADKLIPLLKPPDYISTVRHGEDRTG